MGFQLHQLSGSKPLTLTLKLILLGVLAAACTLTPWSSFSSQVKSGDDHQKLRMVWVSLDGFQPEALQPWVRQLTHPHPKGLRWLMQSTHGRSDLKVINPTITAPSHISTITCAGAGLHGIMDNNAWTGSGTTSGFNKPYDQETWIGRLRKQGLKVGVSLYPSMDGASDSRSGDIGLAYDNPGSQPQIVAVGSGTTVSVSVPDRGDVRRSYPLEVAADSRGSVVVKTPWGEAGPLAVAKPVDVFFTAKMNGVDRRAAVTVMLLSGGSQATVEISPVQMMPAYDASFRQALDDGQVVFSSLKDYRIQGNLPAFLAAMEHRRKFILAANKSLLARKDLDVAFFYFEDLDSLLHGFDRDDAAMPLVVDYLQRFDQDLGEFMASLPSSTDLVVLGDHGMSAIAYVLNARKILGAELAAQGTLMTGGGALYLYPPQGDIAQDPPATLNLEAAAERLRQMELDLTGQKLFGKVIVRGSRDAQDEGLSGKKVPWLMAFAHDGVAFKNSVEDTLLLARAKWAVIPEALRAKYPDPMLNGSLVVPVPAGQHGHWNELPQMRTRLILEGPRLSKVDPNAIEKTLQLVPAVADQLGLQRPESCAH
jgi:predicted AlkP superfamily pyrophosphatase or phosphodiesterase